MACNIFTDDNGIKRVVADNGNPSLLYLDALKTNTKESAIEIWAISQTQDFEQEFKNTKLDKNGEPNLKDVLSYIFSKNILETLSEQEVFEAKQSLMGTEYKDAHELAIKIKDALLIPKKENLLKINYYNNSEINDILQDNVLRNKILEFSQKVINTNVEIIQNFDVDSDFITVNINQKNVFGKYKIKNPNVLKSEIIQQLGGIKDISIIEQKILEKEYPITFNNTLLEDLSQFNRIPIVEIIDNKLVPKKNDTISQTIKATLQDDKNRLVRDLLLDLEGISLNVWKNNPKDIKILLRNIEENAIQISLDLKGLENNYDKKTRNEILELSRSLDFLLNNTNENNFNNFIEIYESFFEIDKTPKEFVTKVNNQFKNLPLIKLETKNSEYKLFKELGLLKIDKNIYIKTDSLKKTLEEVEVFMEANNITITDEELNNKIFEEDVNDSEYNIEELKKLINYRRYFKTDSIKISISSIKIPNTKVNNLEYLKSDFIADIRKLQLLNPSNTVLQNLQFNDKGIRLKNDDEISIKELNSYFKVNKDLKNYFLLNKNTSFNIEEFEENLDERLNLVNGRVNSEFKGDYTKINNEVLQIETNLDYLTIDRNNYERTRDNFFVKLPNNDSDFYLLNVEKPDLNINSSEYVLQKNNPKVEFLNKYTKKQSEEITKEIDCTK
jgi:hypothetical protein